MSQRIYLDEEEVFEAYVEACDEADIWRKDYPEYERLMDNGLLDNLDPSLPEVNDGSLSASLFKLAKRVLRKKMVGRARALDTDDAWITELANIEWESNILPNARSKAKPRTKWKDAIRKAAGYGSQPIVTLFVNRGNYEGADFIVPYAPDVKLEAGKDSDADSDIIFMDFYYKKNQWANMIEEAKEENEEAKLEKKQWQARKAAGGDDFDEDEPEPYNEWDVACMEEILNSPQEERPGNEESITAQQAGIKRQGIHVFIAVQRGVNAPFMMCYPGKKKAVRRWSNPDPTGDVPVHYLYCYQDFKNPYGIGIVKLAGGTQNVLDYMRKMDILATMLGIRPPKKIKGDANEVDMDSLVYAMDANWEVGTADVERMEMSNQVYQALPERIEMYLNSLNKVLPMGDTTVSATAGDPLQSKTPAGVKQAQAMLSIDDEDFMESIDDTYEDVARSMINTHFANMQGSDLRQLTTEQRDILVKAGLDTLQPDDMGEGPLELEIAWDQARATFDYEIDADADKTSDEQTQMEGLTGAAELLANPNMQQLIMQAQTGEPLILGTQKIDIGELFGTLINLSTDNDKIVTAMTQDEINQQKMMAEQQAAMQQGIDPETGEPIVDPAMAGMEGQVPEGEVVPAEGEITPEEAQANVEAVMEEHQVPLNVAIAMLEAERLGESDEAIEQLKQMLLEDAMQPTGPVEGAI
jgi:hypothetical protein